MERERRKVDAESARKTDRNAETGSVRKRERSREIEMTE